MKNIDNFDWMEVNNIMKGHHKIIKRTTLLFFINFAVFIISLILNGLNNINLNYGFALIGCCIFIYQAYIHSRTQAIYDYFDIIDFYYV